MKTVPAEEVDECVGLESTREASGSEVRLKVGDVYEGSHA